jgi:hypothetical protein
MTDLRDMLIERLGEPTYRMMFTTVCHFMGISESADPAFVDRCITDGLEKFDHPVTIGGET